MRPIDRLRDFGERHRSLSIIIGMAFITALLPLLVLMLRQDGWRPRVSQAWLLLGPAAALGFFLYIGSLTGSKFRVEDLEPAMLAAAGL